MAHKERSSSCTRLGKERSSGSGEENSEQQLMPMCIQIQQNEAFGAWLKSSFRCSVDRISHDSAFAEVEINSAVGAFWSIFC